MKVLFVSGLGHLPQTFGGVQSNTHEMALELIRHGHGAAVAAQFLPSAVLGFRIRLLSKLGWKKTLCDRGLGYPVYRRWNVKEALPDLVKTIRPDVVVLQPAQDLHMARELRRLLVPTIVYFHDVLFHELTVDPASLDNVVFLANSEFTAKRCRERYGIEATAIPPLFRAKRYSSNRTPKNVTFINPHPYKGIDIGLKLVSRCPDIPFRFIKSWDLPEEQNQRLVEFTKAHPNLTVGAPTLDMKPVYAHAKIVLIPSTVDEAWGRVASEAQFSGIPVIASNRGGLPEAVGPGGVLLDPEGPIELWVQALRKLWSDNTWYAELSAAALAHSARPALDPEVQIDAFLLAAERAIGLNKRAHSPAPDHDETEVAVNDLELDGMTKAPE